MICPNCGEEISGVIAVCEFCGAQLPKKKIDEEPEEVLEETLEQEPKPLMGFLGALIGAAISCALIMLLWRFGLLPSFGCIAIAFLVFMFSGLLNKNRTKIGFGVCIMFIVFTPYIADRLVWAAKLVQNAAELKLAEDITLFEAFMGMPIMLDAEKIHAGEYLRGLFNSYIFTAIGAVAYLAGVARGKKKKQMKQDK